MVQNALKRSNMLQSPIFSNMLEFAPIWSKNGPKLVQNVSIWSIMVQNALNCYKMLKMLRNAPKCS